MSSSDLSDLTAIIADEARAHGLCSGNPRECRCGVEWSWAHQAEMIAARLEHVGWLRAKQDQ